MGLSLASAYITESLALLPARTFPSDRRPNVVVTVASMWMGYFAINGRASLPNDLKQSVSSDSGMALPRPTDCAAMDDEDAITSSGHL
jgi:hypothetical protein